MTFIDLFSGIGGFRRGLERSGHKCVGHVEIDKYANKSYCAMYGLVPCKYNQDTASNSYMLCDTEVNENCDGKSCKGEWYAKDIKRVGAGEIPNAEIWTFGFPCTDISIAGRMAGLHGERSGLFFTVTGLLKSQSPEDRPKRLIIENVKHLVSSERGGAFTTVLSELWEAGYECEWAVVNSKDFNVPQHRERVYIVGRLRGQCGRKVFPVGGTNQTPVKQILGKTQGNRLYDPTGLSVTMTSNGGGFAGRTGLYSVSVNRKEGVKGCIDTAHTLTASDTRGINRNQDQNAVIEEKLPCACFIDMNEQAKATGLARCVKARQYAGISRHKGETSGVFLCPGNPDCVRAVITPEREEKRQNGRRFKAPGEPSFTLTGQDQHGIMLCCCDGWKQDLPVTPNEAHYATGVIRIANVNPSGSGINGNVYDSKGICPTLTTNKGEGPKIAVHEHSQQNSRYGTEPNEQKRPLASQDLHNVILCCCEGWKQGLPIREAKKDGHTMAYHGDGITLSYPNSTVSRGRVGKQVSQTVMTGGQMGVLLCCRIRRLTPRETWRLQAFEDELFDRARAAGISDAQLYKQAGNAVTVNVVYEIGLKINQVERGFI